MLAVEIMFDSEKNQIISNSKKNDKGDIKMKINS